MTAAEACDKLRRLFPAPLPVQYARAGCYCVGGAVLAFLFPLDAEAGFPTTYSIILRLRGIGVDGDDVRDIVQRMVAANDRGSFDEAWGAARQLLAKIPCLWLRERTAL